MVRRKIAEMKFVGGVFSYREADEGEDGTWCDWWDYEDLRYPLVRLMAAAGVPREEITDQPDHDGRHAQGLLGPEGTPRGHGHQPDRGVAVVPDVPPVLRADVPRAQGQGARGPLREGLQRLDVRRVVRRLQRPPDPAADHPALGRAARGRRGATQRGAWRRTRCASPRSRRSSACRRCTTPTATGTRSSRRARRPRRVVCMHIGSSSKMPSTSRRRAARGRLTLTYMNAAMSLTDYLMSGIFERSSRRSSSRTPRARSAGSRTSSTAPTRSGPRTAAWGGVADKVKRPAEPEYYHESIFGCFFDDPHGLKSLESIGADNITFETDYPHSDSRGRTRGRSRWTSWRASTTRRSSRSSGATRSGCSTSTCPPDNISPGITHGAVNAGPARDQEDLA